MHWEFVIPGYAITVACFGAYALATLRRGRKLSERVPEGKRRFLDA